LKNKYKIAEFEPKDYWHGAYLGCDFGFSQDPTTLIKSWIFKNTLYIEYEAWGVGIEIDHLPQLFEAVPNSKNYVIYADSARPETISYLRRQGYNIRPSKKGKGSVLDGVAHLRGYDAIVIHPRCVKTIEEARLWSYKVDKLSGDVLPVLASGYDHCFDAIRYSLEPIMRSGSKGVSITTPTDSTHSIW
jgi:phage terminase large subunit